ncbi:hypothetical protein CLF_100630 [Clonorchis sinensis]|uniref:MD-2-related lipid-recognition domain-containing protein n=1 Tax=Clonorchis sinensis TaxID=79923 RepID=G7Y3W4_CLOSI|nr:hypothetical protein CLF_100630 [Clonorchis sinensis]
MTDVTGRIGKVQVAFADFEIPMSSKRNIPEFRGTCVSGYVAGYSAADFRQTLLQDHNSFELGPPNPQRDSLKSSVFIVQRGIQLKNTSSTDSALIGPCIAHAESSVAEKCAVFRAQFSVAELDWFNNAPFVHFSDGMPNECRNTITVVQKPYNRATVVRIGPTVLSHIEVTGFYPSFYPKPELKGITDNICDNILSISLIRLHASDGHLLEMPNNEDEQKVGFFKVTLCVVHTMNMKRSVYVSIVSSRFSRVRALRTEEIDQTTAQIEIANRLQETGYPKQCVPFFNRDRSKVSPHWSRANSMAETSVTIYTADETDQRGRVASTSSAKRSFKVIALGIKKSWSENQVPALSKRSFDVYFSRMSFGFQIGRLQVPTPEAARNGEQVAVCIVLIVRHQKSQKRLSGSVVVKPLSVDVNGCNFEDDICNLKRGSTFVVHIKFQSDVTITATGAKAEGKFDGNYLEVLHPFNEMCDRLTPPCYIQAGVVYTESYTVVMTASLPPGTEIARQASLESTLEEFGEISIWSRDPEEILMGVEMSYA